MLQCAEALEDREMGLQCEMIPALSAEGRDDLRDAACSLPQGTTLPSGSASLICM